MDPEVAVRRIGEGIMPILSVPSRKTVDVWLELGEGNGQVHIDFQVSCSNECGAASARRISVNARGPPPKHSDLDQQLCSVLKTTG